MKNQNNRNDHRTKHPAIAITASLFETRLLKNMVEKLADLHYDMGYNMEKVQLGWQAIEPSSIEAYVSGDINFSENADSIDMPFVTSFVFTCIKVKGGKYKLAWASSLS